MNTVYNHFGVKTTIKHNYDAETGNTYMLARYYDAEVGRFLRPDPVGSADDFVLYAYVHGNPTNATDPTGMVHEYAQPRGLGGGFGMGLEGSDLINAGDGASNEPETDPTGNAQQDTGTTNTEPTMLASAAGNTRTDASPNSDSGTTICTGPATITAVGGNQARADGALHSNYPEEAGGSIKGGTNGTVAVKHDFLGLSRQSLRAHGTEISIELSAAGQARSSAYGGPTGKLTVSDYGDRNIQNTPGAAFDMYRFPSVKDGRGFGTQPFSVTIRFPSSIGGHCETGFQTIRSP